MSAPRKYDREFRERAVRMYRDRLEQGETSQLGGASARGCAAGPELATLRNRVQEVERAEGTRPAVAGGRAGERSDSEEVRALKKRVAELERANDILKTSAAFFAQAELDRRFK